MNTKNLLIASLVGAVITVILTNAPILSVVNCVLCAGFWLGPLFAVWMYRRQSGTVTLGQGIGVGTLAGFWAAVVIFLISRVTNAGTEALVASYTQLVPPEAGLPPLPSGPLAIFIELLGAGFAVFFGFLGGLIGGAIFKTPTTTLTPSA